MKNYLAFLGMLLVMSACDVKHEPKIAVSTNSRYYSVVKQDKLLPAAEYDSIIAVYKVGVDSVMRDEIILSDYEFRRAKPSGSLDNLIADAMMQQVSKEVALNVDIAMYNYYGIRGVLSKGMLTRGDVFEVLPFENQATLVHLNPKGVSGLISYIYRTGGQPLSGIKIEFIDSATYNVSIGGHEIDTSKYYWVVTSDYAANGGDNMSFFQDSDSIFYTGMLIRDNLLNYLEELQAKSMKLEIDTNKRVTFKEINKEYTLR